MRTRTKVIWKTKTALLMQACQSLNFSLCML